MSFNNLPGALIIIAATVLLPVIAIGFTLWRSGSNPPEG